MIQTALFIDISLKSILYIWVRKVIPFDFSKHMVWLGLYHILPIIQLYYRYSPDFEFHVTPVYPHEILTTKSRNPLRDGMVSIILSHNVSAGIIGWQYLMMIIYQKLE